MSEQPADYGEATVMVSPAPMSSVEIASRAKGAPAITVKCYAGTLEDATVRACAAYDALVAQYAEEPTP